MGHNYRIVVSNTGHNYRIVVSNGSQLPHCGLQRPQGARGDKPHVYTSLHVWHVNVWVMGLIRHGGKVYLRLCKLVLFFILWVLMCYLSWFRKLCFSSYLPTCFQYRCANKHGC
jgi:hypothetical protein